MLTQPKLDGKNYPAGINLSGSFYDESANLSLDMMSMVFLEGD